jgi:proline dehydrogenase
MRDYCFKPMTSSTNSIDLRAAAALRRIALNEEIKAYVLQHEPLYQTFLRVAARFIGGETLTQCIEVAKSLNHAGFAVTVDYMGESTRDAAIADGARGEFLEVINAISKEGLDASVSLDLSHIGMAVDAKSAYKRAQVLVETAKRLGREVMISMEGANRTSLILEIYYRLCEGFDNVGITLQAYLYRTPNDIQAALLRPGKIRLVKGAYDEPSTVAMSRGRELDTTFCHLMESILRSGQSCSIATHDKSILDRADDFIQANKINRDKVEFEMLHGVTPNLLEDMRDRAYRTRVFLPYGREWYLYLCNRLSEHPPNIYQAIVDAVEFG